MTDIQPKLAAGSDLLWQPVSSRVSFAFWKGLSSRKVNVWKLSQVAQPLVGFLSGSGRSPTLEVRAGSFADASAEEIAGEGVRLGEVGIDGRLVLVNSAAEFRSYDKSRAMADCSSEQWKILQKLSCGDTLPDARAEPENSSVSFTLLVHADIKEHRYVHVATRSNRTIQLFRPNLQVYRVGCTLCLQFHVPIRLSSFLLASADSCTGSPFRPWCLLRHQPQLRHLLLLRLPHQLHLLQWISCVRVSLIAVPSA